MTICTIHSPLSPPSLQCIQFGFFFIPVCIFRLCFCSLRYKYHTWVQKWFNNCAQAWKTLITVFFEMIFDLGVCYILFAQIKRVFNKSDFITEKKREPKVVKKYLLSRKSKGNTTFFVKRWATVRFVNWIWESSFADICEYK